MDELFDSVDRCMEILAEAYPSAEIRRSMPLHHPKTPVIMISQTGGTENAFLRQPVMTITCWDATDKGAKSLVQNSIQTIADAALTDELLSAVEVLSITRDEYAPDGYGCYESQVRLTFNV